MSVGDNSPSRTNADLQCPSRTNPGLQCPSQTNPGLQCLSWSRVARNPVLGVSDQVRHKPGYISTKYGLVLEISDSRSRRIVLKAVKKVSGSAYHYIMTFIMRESHVFLSFGFTSRSDANRAVQPQKMARCFKFGI